ncbi:ABC transporter ATP-binding protein [Salicibibacter kimchii]|uniref:ABC transporter ATP-binding protein n=1 Tax=Salicibibacter kimchii TaxID=2099786 RepID=A0A345BYD1_9BACI|nr:ABC transporter ATP-binding protein [Salicibibacter kimchii]AXF55962.1 ABC transporter ATP-binding protein [Salicibibacter kimchii]
MASIEFTSINKAFGDDTVIKDMNLTVKDGSFTVLVGPSGCGKSTTLRMIAGLEKQTSGDIYIGDRLMNDVAPGKRDVAMVFQNYALYPTMTVGGNIEFGLKNRKVPKTERKTLIEEISEIVGLTAYLDKKPQTLSGGQRQRVALARAMVKKPKVFVLDEPLSNLDAKLRHQMRTELVQLHQRLGTTFIYVTHDQVEAMSMADEIVLLNHGEIQQMASPLQMYQHPANLFTAQFIGTPSMNTITSETLPETGNMNTAKIAHIGFRPEHAQLAHNPRNDGLSFPGTILTREILGTEVIYQVETYAGKIFVKTFGMPIESSNTVYVHVPEKDIYYFKANGMCLMPNVSEESEIALVGGR